MFKTLAAFCYVHHLFIIGYLFDLSHFFLIFFDLTQEVQWTRAPTAHVVTEAAALLSVRLSIAAHALQVSPDATVRDVSGPNPHPHYMV